ncbi:hypothetical protein JAAARDRAFT_485569 [Jaapia argillacea MUCL 33604]|uniref:Uncharacterized protein n=1 Tax=Jaapia argillacea MUCL 33604 TaxID=933084 RepID=A0A067PEF3_9AGAM|nr:hypothetical protein JAAARDRAFT_485569 [Jaapia argillacea MUCL 33604]
MVIASTLHFLASRLGSGRSVLKDGALGSSDHHSCLHSSPTMSNFLDVIQIQAKSSVPLYVRLADGTRPSVQKDVWNWLWIAGAPTPKNAFTAFDTTTSATVPLAVGCRFNLLASTRLYLRGLLNGLEVLSSPTPINPNGAGSGNATVTTLEIKYPLPSPIAYRGWFTWVLGDQNGTIVVTATARTHLELYAFKAPIGTAMKMWLTRGIFVNLFRAHMEVFDNRKREWTESDARRALVQSVYNSVFQYDIGMGNARYTADGFGRIFRLELYSQDLEARAAMWINCYDMAAIIQVALTLHPGYDKVRWNYMNPYGLINTTTLKGWPNPCNSPFWGGNLWSPSSYAPPNYDAGTEKQRILFNNHAFIALAVDSNPLNHSVLDATSGPHVGDERLSQYLKASIDTTTNYYARYKTRPGTVSDIDIKQAGIVSLENFPPAARSSQPLAILPGDESSVEATLDRSKVPNPDPPRFTRVNYTSLQNLATQKLSLKLVMQDVEPTASGCHSYWRFGDGESMVEISLAVVESQEAAVDAMRGVLSCISAPLDVIFPSNAGLGQRSLSVVGGGRGYILFVRDNVFVSMQGLESSEGLKEMAGLADQALKDLEVDTGGRVDGPILRGGAPTDDQPPRKVKLGEMFEVTVPVDDAGWMEASADIGVVQLVNIDKEHATFKFHAAGEGTTEIVLAFVHGETLKTTSVKVAVEVLPGKEESPMLEL